MTAAAAAGGDISMTRAGSNDGGSAISVLAEAGGDADVGETGDVNSNKGVFGVQIRLQMLEEGQQALDAARPMRSRSLESARS